ncbi:acyl-CoA thioesterase [Syntrophorhabdus aromaticivorans]|uniref:Acyl-CoA thioesterase n=1 Tax=Syntrophorhabdus aromaticivorans TaxID=328301 RepID=A0A971M3H2_9BACT|nr:thioesterase family protein [Syntrophorhabdus aromaticivorans]NLW34687.1 acyl-CoA thioesterase [Syntrophorhabdus aromaticivorans]
MYSTRIYYQDTDAGGVVYFANYLRLFEKSWFEYLISLGISLPEWEKMGIYVLIRTAFVDLREKLHYGDIVNITTSIKEVKNAYFVLTHAVSKNGQATTKGEIKMVCVDKNGKPKRLPEDFRNRLLAALDSPRTSPGIK